MAFWCATRYSAKGQGGMERFASVPFLGLLSNKYCWAICQLEAGLRSVLCGSMELSLQYSHQYWPIPFLFLFLFFVCFLVCSPFRVPEIKSTYMLWLLQNISTVSDWTKHIQSIVMSLQPIMGGLWAFRQTQMLPCITLLSLIGPQ